MPNELTKGWPVECKIGLRSLPCDNEFCDNGILSTEKQVAYYTAMMNKAAEELRKYLCGAKGCRSSRDMIDWSISYAAKQLAEIQPRGVPNEPCRCCNGSGVTEHHSYAVDDGAYWYVGNREKQKRQRRCDTQHEAQAKADELNGFRLGYKSCYQCHGEGCSHCQGNGYICAEEYTCGKWMPVYN